MLHSTRLDRERLAGDEPARRFSILSVYQVHKLASDKAQINFERNDSIMATYPNSMVTGGKLRVRKYPRTTSDSTIMGNLNNGTSITVADYNDDWLKISGGSYNGYYVMRKFVDTSYNTSLTSSQMFGSSNVVLHSSGKYVYNLQHILNRFLDQIDQTLLVVDGDFGSATHHAVKDFQGAYWSEESGLVDGIVGPTTKSVLINYLNSHNS